MVCSAQTPGWSWAKSIGGDDYEVALSSDVDVAGNLYVAGYFNSPSISFDAISITNADTSQSHADNSDMFVVKYDNNGNIKWAKSAGGKKSDQASCVRTDVFGNVYVSGNFKSSSVTFGSFVLANSGMSDMFIVKYNSNGDVLWAKSAGDAKEDEAVAIAIDKNGNCYVTGTFESAKISFGTDTIKNNPYKVSPKSNTVFGDVLAEKSNIFIVKYDKDGKIVWTQSAGGKYSDIVCCIDVDISDNFYIAGYFKSPSIVFGTDTLINSDTNKVMLIEEGNFNPADLFIAKYNAAGKVLWSKKAGNSMQDDIAKSIATDATGNLYVSGFFECQSIKFGALTLTNKNTDQTSDLFIVKYDTNGKESWARSAGGRNDDEAKSIVVDSLGNCYVTGSFYSSFISFDRFKLTSKSPGKPDIFVAKYSSDGKPLWTKSAGGKGYDEVQSIAIDHSGNCFLAGAFIESEPNFNNIKLSNAGLYDIFIARLNNQ